ncbi:DUF6461 domain-containing protein [Streptomyces macrosporus]|uniref:Uncharacterized protein n=1 Tax=Streptomyces macrosporus TaxID=44032 RepID=A0ABN3KI28_9ACTN
MLALFRGGDLDLFHHFAHGVRTVLLEPLFPERRDGADPDRFLTAMREVGLVAEPDGVRRRSPGEIGLEGLLDLATAATGFRIDPEVFRGPLPTGELGPIDMPWLDSR